MYDFNKHFLKITRIEKPLNVKAAAVTVCYRIIAQVYEIIIINCLCFNLFLFQLPSCAYEHYVCNTYN